MKTCLLALATLALLSGAARADAIADRQAAMKSISGHVRQLAPFAQGKSAYDAAAVGAELAALQWVVAAFDVDALFPAGSEAGDTKASPKIWQDRPGFQAAVDRFKGDIDAAVAAAPADAAALGPLFAAIGANCGACHGAWRQ
ncbi:MAG: cytochrome c [Rhizobiaceae bacterium]|nr:cytochrome c [Rhizobiaceae bacterium]